MIISLRLSEMDAELVKLCAVDKGITVSSFIRDVLMDRIESDFEKIVRKGEVVDEE